MTWYHSSSLHSPSLGAYNRTQNFYHLHLYQPINRIEISAGLMSCVYLIMHLKNLDGQSFAISPYTCTLVFIQPNAVMKSFPIYSCHFLCLGKDFKPSEIYWIFHFRNILNISIFTFSEMFWRFQMAKLYRKNFWAALRAAQNFSEIWFFSKTILLTFLPNRYGYFTPASSKYPKLFMIKIAALHKSKLFI